MKKLLLGIITVLMLILTTYTVVKGFKIGNWQTIGILDMKTEDEQLNDSVKQATKLASTDYQKKMDDLNEQIKKLESEKTSYYDMVNVSTDSEVEAANQTYDYDIGFLWIKIENHAKIEGVKMKMDLTQSSSGAEKTYNLNFTATGSYIGIADFISDIEEDSKLGFKIEEFKMQSLADENNNVQATFVCKEVKIDGISTNTINTQPSTNTDTQTNSNTTTDTLNNTNSTNSTTNK